MGAKNCESMRAHMGSKVARFGQMRNRSHGLDPKHDSVCDPEQFKDKFKENHENMQMTNTVEENLKCLWNVQQNEVKKVRRPCQALGTPAATDLKAMIRMSLMKEKEVTSKDATLAEKVCGLDIGGVKGKTTGVKPSLVKPQTTDMPKELINLNQDTTTSVDNLKNNQSSIFSGNIT